MNAMAKITSLLEKEAIHYEILEHGPAYTALETAQAQHIPGRRVVKAIIVQADQRFIMCVLPATHKIDMEKLQQLLKVQDLHLADEMKTKQLFPDFELGAMPPFGQLANLPTYADKTLEENESIVFNAGSHVEMIRIKFKDYIRLVKPTFADFGVHI